MKHKTPDSMKFKRLMRALGESRRGTTGLLELLWIATQNNAKRGDIGRFSNEDIAIECDWEGDPDFLVKALVDCGWLDVSEEHRLVIHDWQDHCPVYLKKAVRDAGGFISSGSIDPSLETQSIDPPVKGSVVETPPIRNVTKPNVTQRNVTKPNTHSVESSDPTGGRNHPSFEDWWKTYPNKQGKADAEKKFKRFKPNQIHDLRTATRHYVEAIDAGVNNGKFMIGSTFINGRYLDWVNPDPAMIEASKFQDHKPETNNQRRARMIREFEESQTQTDVMEAQNVKHIA